MNENKHDCQQETYLQVDSCNYDKMKDIHIVDCLLCENNKKQKKPIIKSNTSTATCNCTKLKQELELSPTHTTKKCTLQNTPNMQRIMVDRTQQPIRNDNICLKLFCQYTFFTCSIVSITCILISFGLFLTNNLRVEIIIGSNLSMHQN
jgi:hypothetical protein